MAEIHGKGTNFRFIRCWDHNEYGQPTTQYTFLLHKHTVLVGQHDERNFTLTDKGELIIYKPTDKWYAKPMEISGIMFPAHHPMVATLNEALGEDCVEEVLLGEQHVP